MGLDWGDEVGGQWEGFGSGELVAMSMGCVIVCVRAHVHARERERESSWSVNFGNGTPW